ncbi:MAG: AAA family ATPase, partial [Cyanobacteria bacterium J06626_18]
MLEKVELCNFKSHRDTQIVLDDSRLHALVGPNSSGKTSTLETLHYLSRLAGSSFKDVFRYPRSPEFIATVGQGSFSVNVGGFWGYQDHRKNWEASYNFQKDNDQWLPTALCQVDQDEEKALTGWNSSLDVAPYPIPRALKYAVHLKLIANNLAKAAYSDSVTPRVEYDGSGLAPTLDYLRDEAPDKFQSLQEMLKRIVPGVQKVGVRRAKVIVNRYRLIEVAGKSVSYEEDQEVAGQEVILDMNTGDRVPAHSISEGTIL